MTDTKHTPEPCVECSEQPKCKLHAAAPDYDKAATEALEWWHSIPSHFHGKEPAWVNNIRKAIAKAESTP